MKIESSTSYRGRNARPNWIALIAFIGVALAAGGLGALFSPIASTTAVHRSDPATATAPSTSSQAWYVSLKKPSWTPPAAWFGPIWTSLYLLMGTAAWLVWSERYHPARNAAMVSYALQLLLNALWAPIFFGMRNIGAGLFLIIALWLSLAWTVRAFYPVRPAATALMLPYLAWVSLAAALNLAIWRLNP